MPYLFCDLLHMLFLDANVIGHMLTLPFVPFIYSLFVEYVLSIPVFSFGFHIYYHMYMYIEYTCIYMYYNCSYSVCVFVCLEYVTITLCYCQLPASTCFYEVTQLIVMWCCCCCCYKTGEESVKEQTKDRA